PPENMLDSIENTIAQTLSKSRLLHGNERSDAILSLGERLSSGIVSAYISELHPARQVVATELFVTDDAFGSAEIIDQPSADRVNAFKQEVIREGYIPVVTGFIGATEDGRTTTLGRGGSDYSAALLGYYLQADEVQIWTDVDGVF